MSYDPFSMFTCIYPVDAHDYDVLELDPASG